MWLLRARMMHFTSWSLEFGASSVKVMRPHQSSSGEYAAFGVAPLTPYYFVLHIFYFLPQWPRLWCAERRTPKRSGCFFFFLEGDNKKKIPPVCRNFEVDLKIPGWHNLIFSPLPWCASQLKCWSAPKATTRHFLFSLCSLAEKFDCSVLFGSVAQWLRCCATEPKDIGLIPECGGQFSDGKAKTLERWDFGAC